MQLHRLLSALLLLVLSHCAFSQEQADTLIAIANIKGVDTDLTMDEFKDFLKGENQMWNNSTDTKVSLAFLTQRASAFDSATARIVDLDPNDLNELYRELEHQGSFTMPAYFKNAEELEEYVSSKPGAIGISSKATITYKGVIPLKVNGKPFIVIVQKPK